MGEWAKNDGGLMMCAWKYKRVMFRLTVDKLKLMEPNQITGLVGMSLHHITSVLETRRTEQKSLKLEQKGTVPFLWRVLFYRIS